MNETVGALRNQQISKEFYMLSETGRPGLQRSLFGAVGFSNAL